MTKIDNFKSFVRRNPNLITYVREKNTSWQAKNLLIIIL